MKRKSNFLPDFLCLSVCALLISATVLGSGFFGDTAKSVLSFYSEVKGEAVTGEISVNKSNTKNTGVVFSSGGYAADVAQTTELTATPDDVLALMKDAESMYKNFKKSGNIDEQRMGATSQTVTCGSVMVNNKAGEDINIKALLDSSPSYSAVTKEKPYILIYHTHTTEGYELLDKGWYSDNYNSRTKDSSKNMVRVGDAIAEQLENAGYGVIHDTNIYDSSYNGAYDRSRKSVEKYLKEYPSIQITLDVHRDAIHYDSGTKCKPTAEINGKKAAQVMIISGCEGEGVENFPNWKKNLAFAVSLQANVEERFEGLMRPIFFCHRKYNMDVTKASLLLEFGTDANTLEEAVYSGALVGKALSDMLDKG